MNTNTKRRWLKPALIVIAVALGIAALGFAWYDYRFPSWEEEVLLPDGRKIVVKQRRDFIEGYGTRKTWLTFSLPEMGGERTWVEYMQPALLGISKEGEVFVVGWPTGEKQMGMYRHPRYGFVAFKWEHSSFERVPFTTVPEELRREENLIRCLPLSKGHFFSWETKIQAGCNANGEFVTGASRQIDMQYMQDWALRQAKRNNIKPLSE